MPYKSLPPILLLLLSGLLGACQTGTTVPLDPCITDPNLAGCVGGITVAAPSLDAGNAAAVLSSTLSDVLDITRITLAAVTRSHELKTDIQAVQTTQGNFQQNNAFDGPVPIASPACDNGGSYTIIVQLNRPAQNLSDTTVTVEFGGIAQGSYIDPSVYCTIGGMNISGSLALSNVIFTDNPSQAGSYTLDAKLSPTLTLHNGSTLTTIINPLLVNADYNPNSGLTMTTTVLTNNYINCGTVDNICGLVFTHFPAGSDPNTTPDATYNILRTNFAITAQLDNPNAMLDPLASTLLNIGVNGSILSNRTGTDIDNIEIKTIDPSATSQPLTWTGNVSVVDAPRIAPPDSGALLLTDTASNNNIAATISTTTPGDVDLVITDNAFAPGVEGHITNLTAYWANLMTTH